MAEERKPKIDLKARLGRAQGGAPAPGPAMPVPPAASPSGVPAPMVPRSSTSVVPPRVGGSGAPPPFAAPPGVPIVSPSGVPAPPFAQQQQRRAPAVDPTDPFNAVASASAAPPAAATIKIEIGDEYVAAQQRASKKGMVFFILGALVGGGLGFAFGQRSSDSKGAERAVEGAQEIAGSIEKAQAKVKELNEKIAGAIKDLKDKKYPEAFGNDLGGLSIPFGADQLTGRNIGRFEPKVLASLFKYTSDVEALNDRKDALKNLFVGQKQAITDALAAASNPKVNWSVFVQKSPAHGPLAILAAINPKEAFAYKDANWPAKFKISTGRELVDTDRYATGDVVSADKKVVAVPLDPDSVATAFPNDILMRITSELAKTGAVLDGRSGSPDEEEPGVIKNGEQLVVELRKIGKK